MLLPINPEHVENILLGTKRYEFRKIGCRRAVDRIVMYSTSPISMVVGEVEVLGVIDGTPQEVWEQTSEFSGVSKEFFDSYYRGRERAIAYKLGAAKKYRQPKCLAEFGIRAAPQSFVYITP